MKTKHLLRLGGAIVLLICLFLYIQHEENKSAARPGTSLFAELQGEKIAKIEIAQGSNKAVLENVEDVWQVAARGGYPADLNKIRSLLLKVIDLNVSQRVPGTEKNFLTLGVSDEAVQAGKGKLTFADNTGRTIASLYAGEMRKSGKTPGSRPGQYVRRSDSDSVYLIAEPLPLISSPEQWLDQEFLNVAQQKIVKVTQRNKVDESPLYTLTRGSDGKVAVDPGAKADEEVQQSVVNQTVSSLESVRLSDVIPMSDSDEKLKDLLWDYITTFESSTGLVYTLTSAVKGDKGFVKIDVRFDKDIAEKTKSDIALKNEALKKKFEEDKKKSAEAASPEKQDGAKKDASPEAEFVPLKPEIASALEADRLQKNFAKWVYEVPSFQVGKYRRPLGDIVKAKASEAPTPPASSTDAHPSDSEVSESEAGEDLPVEGE